MRDQLATIGATLSEDERVSVLRYIDRVTEDLRQYFDQRFEQAERELDRTQAQLERRLEGMNEFRDQLREQAGKFVGSDKLDVTLESIFRRINLLERWQSNWTGRMWGIGILVSVLTAVLHMIFHVFWK